MSETTSQVNKEGPKIVQGSILELKNLVRAKLPLIQVVTHDESRFLKEVHATICEPEKLKLFFWSCWLGIVEYTSEDSIYNPAKASETGPWAKTMAPNVALERISEYKIAEKEGFGGAVFAMRDFTTVLAQPVPRIMRDIYENLLSNHKVILAMGGTLAHGPGASKPGIEPSLEKQMIVYRWALPTREEIEGHLKGMLDPDELEDKKSKMQIQYTEQEVYGFTRALQGLTFNEIDNSTVVCMTEMGRLNAKRLLEKKKQIVERSEILEYMDVAINIGDIGGLDNLKAYVKRHANSYSDEAAEFGVDPLKGILLLGPPGSGKSLCAKAVGNIWEVPTLRLDIGKVMSGLVGSSEEKMRAVIATAKSVAPCVLYMDEIEKALSGTKSSNMSDGGTLARVFGTLLTAMEEGLDGVAIIATANDISALPPELIRRFSEVFFVGFPTHDERKEIFSIHLRKKKRNPDDFNLEALALKTHKFTGAEIEKAIKESIARCFNDSKRKLTTEDLLDAVADTKPLSKIMAEPIKKLEDWARDRARFASSEAEKEAGVGKQAVTTSTGKKLSVGELDADLPEIKKSSKSRISNLSK